MEPGLIESSQALHWYRGLKRRRTGIFIPEEDKLLIDYSRPDCDRNSL